MFQNKLRPVYFSYDVVHSAGLVGFLLIGKAMFICSALFGIIFMVSIKLLEFFLIILDLSKKFGRIVITPISQPARLSEQKFASGSLSTFQNIKFFLQF